MCTLLRVSEAAKEWRRAGWIDYPGVLLGYAGGALCVATGNAHLRKDQIAEFCFAKYASHFPAWLEIQAQARPANSI